MSNNRGTPWPGSTAGVRHGPAAQWGPAVAWVRTQVLTGADPVLLMTELSQINNAKKEDHSSECQGRNNRVLSL